MPELPHPAPVKCRPSARELPRGGHPEGVAALLPLLPPQVPHREAGNEGRIGVATGRTSCGKAGAARHLGTAKKPPRLAPRVDFLRTHAVFVRRRRGPSLTNESPHTNACLNARPLQFRHKTPKKKNILRISRDFKRSKVWTPPSRGRFYFADPANVDGR